MKGLKIKTTKRLHSGLLLPFGGIVINSVRARNLCKNSTRVRKSTGKRNTYGDYLAEVDHDVNGIPTSFLDGHSRHYPQDAPKYAWIGSLVCEPSIGERANAELVLMPKSDANLPEYPLINREYIVCVELKEDVPKGTEITAAYNLSRRCYKARGYTPGLAWNEPSPVLRRKSLRFGPGNRSESQMNQCMNNLLLMNQKKRKVN